MVAEHEVKLILAHHRCSLAKISMVAEHGNKQLIGKFGCSLAKISMVAEPKQTEP